MPWAQSGAMRVVLVDSREERRALMTGVVEGDGQEAVVVAEADGPETAVLAVREEEGDAVVLDIGMPVVTGLRTLRELRSAFPSLAIVVCSFDMDRPTIARALAAGADACLPKPASPHELVTALATVLRRTPIATPAAA
jgi:DNA-binding NarL/FixJ family response regulator